MHNVSYVDLNWRIQWNEIVYKLTIYEYKFKNVDYVLCFFCNVLGNSMIKKSLIKYTCALIPKAKFIRARIQKTIN